MERTQFQIEEIAQPAAPEWLESVLPRIMRRLMDTENLDMPLLQLPLAQMRLAQALFAEDADSELAMVGETMGKLSERLGVKQNALTQAADRLVNHELAERRSDASDRRIVRLRLTAEGRSWVRQRRQRRKARLDLIWSVLSDLERDELLQAIRVLEAVTVRLDDEGRLNVLTESTQSVSECDPHTVEETLSRFTVGAANGAAAAIGKRKTKKQE